MPGIGEPSQMPGILFDTPSDESEGRVAKSSAQCKSGFEEKAETDEGTGPVKADGVQWDTGISTAAPFSYEHGTASLSSAP